MPIEFDFEEQFRSISITTSPMHFTTERPRFMSPKPSSPKRLKPSAVRSTSPLPSELGKRDFIIAFGDDAEEQRYGQKIESDFFATNVGHGVFSPTEQKPPATATTPASGLTAEQMHAAVDSVIQDFRQDFRADFVGVQRRERDSESKYDIDEIIEWCEYYRNNRNLFNV